MKTRNLYELGASGLRKKLSEIGVELTTEQYMNLIDEGRTFLYAEIEPSNNNKSRLLFRLSFPLYVIWALIMVMVVQPIKWVCTGDFYFDTKHPLYRFTITWWRKINIQP